MLCFCWPEDLWFLPERALEAGRVSAFGLFALYFSKAFLLSALYHFMFASCMNSCGRGKGKWPTQTLSGKAGPFKPRRHKLKRVWEMLRLKKTWCIKWKSCKSFFFFLSCVYTGATGQRLKWTNPQIQWWPFDDTIVKGKDKFEWSSKESSNNHREKKNCISSQRIFIEICSLRFVIDWMWGGNAW